MWPPGRSFPTPAIERSYNKKIIFVRIICLSITESDQVANVITAVPPLAGGSLCSAPGSHRYWLNVWSHFKKSCLNLLDFLFIVVFQFYYGVLQRRRHSCVVSLCWNDLRGNSSSGRGFACATLCGCGFAVVAAFFRCSCTSFETRSPTKKRKHTAAIIIHQNVAVLTRSCVFFPLRLTLNV